MSITLVSPRETELQKQVIELAESLRNLGWEFELYKTGARATHQKLLDEVDELKADNENLRAYAKHERSLGAEAFAMENLDLTQQVEILKAKLAEYERRYPKSAAETHPMNTNSKCKCEHWQRCEECTPSLKGNTQ